MRHFLLSLLLTFGFWGKALALDLDIRNSPTDVLDFSFQIDHSTVDLRENDTLIETNINRVGVLVFNVPESGAHFGLALGYAFGDFTSNPLYQPVDMDGWYIGILARGLAYQSERIAVTMEGRYIYQDISGGGEEQNVSLSWNEYSLSVALHVAITSKLQFFAAPVYGSLDARYRERGATSQTLKMDSDNNAGFLAGLRYKLDPRESISLQYQEHVFVGVVLEFRRLF